MTTKQEIRITYMEKISIKSDSKKNQYYQISKKFLQVVGHFSGHDHKTINYN